MPEAAAKTEAETTASPSRPPLIRVDQIQTRRISPDCIRISWSCKEDAQADEYIVKKRLMENGRPKGRWTELAAVKGGAGEYAIEDLLTSAAPVQYEYRVDVRAADGEVWEGAEGSAVLGSNVMICIDPGHYAGKNASPDGNSFPYAEGDFTLEVALRLKELLKEEYGIDSSLTRESGSIILDGYQDQELDQGHISLRGRYAAREQSSLFVSIHTNANRDNANGCPTWEQPIAANKTLVFANIPAQTSKTALKAANAIGIQLSRTNYELGLSAQKEFRAVSDAGELREWTEEYNDSLNQMGTVVYRTDEGQDYYGVLRGAASAGIPGIIIEHGLHTIPEVREAAQNGLSECWARADAWGIACGFGFTEPLKAE